MLKWASSTTLLNKDDSSTQKINLIWATHTARDPFPDACGCRRVRHKSGQHCHSELLAKNQAAANGADLAQSLLRMLATTTMRLTGRVWPLLSFTWTTPSTSTVQVSGGSPNVTGHMSVMKSMSVRWFSSGLKSAQKQTPRSPKKLQELPRNPKKSKEAPEATGGSRKPQEDPETPKRPQEAPRGPRKLHKTPQEAPGGPRTLQEA